MVQNEADKQEISKKIHVGYASEDISMEDLRQAFEQYGYVTDIFIPKPFRNFAFVTFDSSDAAQSLIGQTITILGHSLTIGSAVPKINSNRKGMQAHFSMYAQDNTMQNQAYQTRYAPGMIPTYGAAWPPSYDIAAAQKAARASSAGLNNGSSGMSGMNSGSNTMGGMNSSAAAAYGTYSGLIATGHGGQTYMVSNGSRAGQEALQQGGYASQQDMMHQQYVAQQQYATDAGQHGSAANTALNILNNPDVVAAIVAAASKGGQSGGGTATSVGKYKQK